MNSFLQQSIWGEAVQGADVAAYLLREGFVLAVNRATEELTGYTADELIGGVAPTLAADADSIRQSEEVAAGTRTSGTARLQRKDGSVIPVSYVVASTRVARDALRLGFVWHTPSQ